MAAPTNQEDDGCPSVNISHQVSMGDNVKLGCKFSASPDPIAVRWKHISTEGVARTLKIDGKHYSGATRLSPSLFIKYASKKDEGRYICFVENCNGIGKSLPVYLTVATESPKLKSPQEVYQAVAGRPIILQCDVERSKLPLLQIDWYKGTNLIDIDNQKYIGGSIQSPSLVINHCEKEADEGEYVCVAWNEEGKGDKRLKLRIYCENQEVDTELEMQNRNPQNIYMQVKEQNYDVSNIRVKKRVDKVVQHIHCDGNVIIGHDNVVITADTQSVKVLVPLDKELFDVNPDALKHLQQQIEERFSTTKDRVDVKLDYQRENCFVISFVIKGAENEFEESAAWLAMKIKTALIKKTVKLVDLSNTPLQIGDVDASVQTSEGDNCVVSISKGKYSAPEGVTVIIQCAIISSIEPSSVEWFRIVNDTRIPVVIDNKKYLSGSATCPSLVITETQRKDEGIYFCHAKFGNDDKESNRTFLKIPSSADSYTEIIPEEEGASGVHGLVDDTNKMKEPEIRASPVSQSTTANLPLLDSPVGNTVGENNNVEDTILHEFDKQPVSAQNLNTMDIINKEADAEIAPTTVEKTKERSITEPEISASPVLQNTPANSLSQSCDTIGENNTVEDTILHEFDQQPVSAQNSGITTEAQICDTEETGNSKVSNIQEEPIADRVTRQTECNTYGDSQSSNWFTGCISIESAIAFLQQSANGTYLCRLNLEKNKLYLLIKHNMRIHQYPIHQRQQNGTFWIKDLSFPSVKHLLHHYMKNIVEDNIYLSQPFNVNHGYVVDECQIYLLNLDKLGYLKWYREDKFNIIGKSRADCNADPYLILTYSDVMAILSLACKSDSQELCMYLCQNNPVLSSRMIDSVKQCLHSLATFSSLKCFKAIEALKLRDKSIQEISGYYMNELKSENGRTVLHLACSSGSTQICRYLCKTYPELINQRDNDGCHCLHFASISNSVACYEGVLAFVLKSRTFQEQICMESLVTNDGETILHLACSSGCREMCVYLCQCYPALLSARDRQGSNCLHYAASSGSMKCYQTMEDFLVRGKFDWQKQENICRLENINRQTMLHKACFFGCQQICVYLCNKYPRLISMRDKQGWHPLHYAAKSGSLECYKAVEDLALNGENLEERHNYMLQLESETGQTVIHMACSSGCKNISMYLCKNYPRLLSTKDKHGSHCLHYAAKSGSLQCFKTIAELEFGDKLVQQTVSLDQLRNENDETVLHWACLSGSRNICIYLCNSYPSLISQKDKQGGHCLHYAAVSRSLACYKTVEELCFRNKYVSGKMEDIEKLKTNDGDTVFSLALSSSCQDIYKYLCDTYHPGLVTYNQLKTK